jgi:hypothetical protein
MLPGARLNTAILISVASVAIAFASLVAPPVADDDDLLRPRLLQLLC